MLAFLAAVEQLPSGSRIGYSLGECDWDYPLFGDRLDRTLVRLPSGSQLAVAERERLRWVVVRSSYLRGQPRQRWRSMRLGHSGFELLTYAGTV